MKELREVNSRGGRAGSTHEVTSVISACSLAIHQDKGVDDPGEVTCFAGSNKGSNSEVQSLSSFQSDSGDDNGKKSWLCLPWWLLLPVLALVIERKGMWPVWVLDLNPRHVHVFTSFLVGSVVGPCCWRSIYWAATVSRPGDLHQRLWRFPWTSSNVSSLSWFMMELPHPKLYSLSNSVNYLCVFFNFTNDYLFTIHPTFILLEIG